MNEIPVGTLCILVQHILKDDPPLIPIGSYCTVTEPLAFYVWDDHGIETGFEAGFAYVCELPDGEDFWALPEELHPLYPPPEKTDVPRQLEKTT